MAASCPLQRGGGQHDSGISCCFSTGKRPDLFQNCLFERHWETSIEMRARKVKNAGRYLQVLLDFLPKCLHVPCEHCSRVLPRTAQLERAKVLVPVAFGSHRPRSHPLLQPPEVGQRNLSLLYPFQKMLPERAREIRELYRRQ